MQNAKCRMDGFRPLTSGLCLLLRAMTEITSLHNPRVKAAVRLRNGRHRQRERRILIDGTRELARAMGARVRLLEAFVCETLCTGEARELLIRLAQCGAEVFQVSQPVFEKLA